MSKVLKGRITVANATTCQIKVNDSPVNIIPNVIIPYEMQGNIHVGDYVAFVLFNDLSGLVLNLMSGSGSASGISVQTDLESDDPATLPGGTLPGVTGVLPPRHGGTGTTTGMGAAIDFDSIDINGVLPVTHGGTGTTVAMSAQVDLEKLTGGTLPGDIGVKGILGIANGGTGNSDGYIRIGAEEGTTIGSRSTAEGYMTTASGNIAHAEGAMTFATGSQSHSEGGMTSAMGTSSHAEGNVSSASGDFSHAEGDETSASGKAAHSEGKYSVAGGDYSHAEGFQTAASSDYQHVSGKYNIVDSSDTYAEIVGNGTAYNARSNARTLDWDGNETVAGDLKGYDTVSAIAKRKDLTINSPVSDSTYTGYSYKQAFTWNGVTADHFGDVALKSGTYTGDMAMLTAANSVTLFFSANPSGIVVTVVVYESKLVT